MPDTVVGLRAHRQGRVPTTDGATVEVATWTDGRAWVKVEATSTWSGPHLFGTGGRPTARVLTEAGPVHRIVGGDGLAVHTPTLDLLITGSVDLDAMVNVLTALDVRGVDVPPEWREASALAASAAMAQVPGLLLPPGRPPLLRQEGDAVLAIDDTGDGSILLLTQRPGRHLGPPLDPGVIGVEVRGHEGRFSPERGELEWVEAGVVLSATGEGLDLPGLLSRVATLEAP